MKIAEKAKAPTPAEHKQAREEVKKALGGIQIESVQAQTQFINTLLYGVPGVGKTFLAGSAAKVASMSPVLFIDIEGGTSSIRDHFEVDVLRITEKDGWKALQRVYEELRQKGAMDYKTIVLDSVTEAYKVCMYAVMENVVKNDPDRDQDIPAQRDWGKAGELFRKMIRSFRDLDAHVIFTAHEAEVKDGKTGAVNIQPSLPGKLAKEIPGYLDEVFYLYVKSEDEGLTRKLLTQPTDKYIAKDRSGKLPTVLDDPTMSSIAKAILS